MKATCLFLSFLLGGALGVADPVAGTSPQTLNVTSTDKVERAESKVLKVFFVQDGSANYRAYLVMWKGQEVVVNDESANSTYQVGDTIKFLIVKNRPPNNATDHDVLQFQIIQKRQLTAGKQPVYVDCQPEKVTLYPDMTNVTWQALQQPGNPVEQLLEKVRVQRESKYVVLLIRPQSTKIYRTVRNMIGKCWPIESGYEPVDADFKLELREPGACRPVPQVTPTSKQPVFFECRGNEVFFVDRDGLDAKVSQMLAALPPESKGGNLATFLKAIEAREVRSEFYKVSPKYLLAAMMALEPRKDVHGENREQLGKPESTFQTMLSVLDMRRKYVVFLVRDDSFSVFRQVRSIAEENGFDVGCQCLAGDELIQFGAGGRAIE